jgi:nucleotide-binding universal stress UspA family protein
MAERSASEKSKKGPVFVAHDLAEHGDEALRQGHAWAERTGRELVVCHAMPDLVRVQPLFPQIEIGNLAAIPELHRRLSERLDDRVRELTGREDFEVVVAAGSPHAVLIEQAQAYNASLVVIAATEKKGFERLLIGSTAEQVVRHTSDAVLVARPSPSHGPVVVGTDLSDLALPAVAAAAREAKRRGAELQGAHVLDVAHPFLASFEPSVVIDDKTMSSLREACHEAIKAVLERAGAEGATLVAEGHASHALCKLAEEQRAQLVVVASHGRTGLRRLALGSVAAAVARHAHCSVLIERSHGGDQ